MSATTGRDGTEARNLRLLANHRLDGHGDTMHVNVYDGYAYVGHMGDDRVGTSVLDVSDPSRPRLVTQLHTPPGTHSHKVQVVGELLLVNHERNPGEMNDASGTTWSAGLAIYDISRPWKPEQIGFFATPGKGVHRMTFWHPPYAVMSGSDHGFTDQFFIAADLSDPTQPVEVGRWWLPGMFSANGEAPGWPPGRTYKHHHSIVRGQRAYGGWWDAGLVILDISDLTEPKLVTRLDFGADVSGATHTAMPIPDRDLLVVTDECVKAGPGRPDIEKHVRLVDISDEAHPTVISQFPVPAGDYHDRPGRSGPHNLHEMRPGSFSSSRTIHVTYFNAGLRVFDIADPAAPQEIAYFVPPAAPGCSALQFNDVTVTPDGLIYVTDRAGGGLYILEPEIEFP
jgi:hypothetical protein